ncbi:MAG TPA: DnaJ domain-containing protein [Anaeromyxobacteraceae bacterium]|nr:DnaJ domain-containing protein [Anaeromyxobacteraceae bacterium]
MARILIAENHGPTREHVARDLAAAGFEVLVAEDARKAYEIFVGQRPVALVAAADLASLDDLARRVRETDARALVIAVDREHLGKAVGKNALLPIRPNAYVADPTGPLLIERVRKLVAQVAAARPQLRGTALVLSRAPAAQGEVKPAVVARLLHQVWRSLSEGVLVLDGAGPERRLFFLRGIPVAFESTDPAESLARWLQDGGRMDAAAHQAALEAMATGLSPGAALIAAGVLEPGEPLQAALRAHLRSSVVRCIGLKEGRWRFHPGTEFTSQVQAVEILPLQAILEGARASIPTRQFSEALRAVTEAYPVRTGDFQQILPAAGLTSADLRLALSLDGRTRTREWLDARQKELKDALSLLWFLSMIGVVAFHEAPDASDAVYGKAPPRKKKPLPSDRAEALRQAAMQILPGTYLHALGVDIAADDVEVERAYQEVASRFHPDGFAEYEVGDLADLLASVQDKVTAAYRVLSNPEKRRAYLSFLLLRFELAGARRPGIDVDAEIALKRGERALRARRNAEAVSAMRQAVERNPREPEYLAMLAFASLHDPVLPPSERAHEARRMARKALGLDPEHARGLAVLAMAEERLGDPAEARRSVLAGLKAHADSEVLKRLLFRLNRAGGAR